ncbi:hypothetical protein HDV00_001949 [Rhizophlyctis rosea]|nr:hypothetical protein HDV00_001949 [Rhizophlyctis rosea]
MVADFPFPAVKRSKQSHQSEAATIPSVTLPEQWETLVQASPSPASAAESTHPKTDESLDDKPLEIEATATPTSSRGTSTKDTITFRTLLLEIKQRILLCVRPEDIQRLSQVSREWAAIAGDERWWKIIYRHVMNEQVGKAQQRIKPTKSFEWDGYHRTWLLRYLTDVGKLCWGCHHRSTPIDTRSDDRICRDCWWRYPGYRDIYATGAKKDYKLSEDGLELLPMKQGWETYDGNFQRAYLAKHVKAASYEKYGGPGNLILARVAAWRTFNTGAKIGEQRYAENIKTRKRDLLAALHAKGIPYPSTSIPCQFYELNIGYWNPKFQLISNFSNYSGILSIDDNPWVIQIDTKPRFTLQEVVDITAKMHLIHEHSVFRELHHGYAFCDDDQYDGRYHLIGRGCGEVDEAVKMFEETLREYHQLPVGQRTAEMCSCGQPLIKGLVLAKLR